MSASATEPASTSNEALPSKPYDDDYVFNGPFMRFEKYQDGEFEHDERLFLTALTGQYKLKADGFHRLIAKFIMHLNDAVDAYSSRCQTVEVEVPSFVPKFRSAKVLNNQIELSDVFDCDLKEEHVLDAISVAAYRKITESELLDAKRWLFAAISSLLIQLKIKNVANVERIYKRLCDGYHGRLKQISTVYLFFELNQLKVAIDLKKIERTMKMKSDALDFAICWMVLNYEYYPSANATHLFKFCFLDSAENYGLVLFMHWTEFARDASPRLKTKRWVKICQTVDGISESVHHISQFYKELEKKDKGVRWRYCRLIDERYFEYMGISKNLKACLVFLFVVGLQYYSKSKEYSEFVKSRKKRPGFEKLTDEEEDFLRKDYKYYGEKVLREFGKGNALMRRVLDLPEEMSDSDADY